MELENLKQHKPFKWKIQVLPKQDKKWACVAYMDSRYVMEILDEVCWPTNWQNLFYEVKWKVFCKIWIKIWDDWIWKSDSWALDDDPNVDSETTSKWETSDAFKRAAVQWGIWRFLYEKEIQWITLEEYNSNKYKLTDYINSRLSKNEDNQYSNNDWKQWFNNPELEKLKLSLDKFKDAEEAIKTAKAKYKVSKIMEENIIALFN